MQKLYKVKRKYSTYKIHVRTMFGGIIKTSGKVATQQLSNTRSYAALAGKSKFTAENNSSFDCQLKKSLINNHAQYITDFDIIYEEPVDIQLYNVASLHTKPVNTSHPVSQDINYKFENKPQQIQFHKQPIRVVNDLHIIRNSRQYFEDPKIKENITKTLEYKQLYDKVIAELNAKNIKYRVAQTLEDMQQTGFNVLLKTKALVNTNDLLETLKGIKPDDKK